MTSGNRGQKKTRKQKTKDADLVILERELMEITGAGVSIQQSSRTDRHTDYPVWQFEELDGLIERLRK